MIMSRRRIRAIVRKELREYRRNRSIVVTMAIFPLIFLIQPLGVVLLAPESSSTSLGQMHLLLYMLAIPVLVPAAVAASAVAGEREQGSLEPVFERGLDPAQRTQLGAHYTSRDDIHARVVAAAHDAEAAGSEAGASSAVLW